MLMKLSFFEFTRQISGQDKRTKTATPLSFHDVVANFISQLDSTSVLLNDIVYEILLMVTAMFSKACKLPRLI